MPLLLHLCSELRPRLSMILDFSSCFEKLQGAQLQRERGQRKKAKKTQPLTNMQGAGAIIIDASIRMKGNDSGIELSPYGFPHQVQAVDIVKDLNHDRIGVWIFGSRRSRTA